MGDGLWSGWGVRTMAAGERCVQPARLPQRHGLAARQLAHRLGPRPAAGRADAQLGSCKRTFEAAAYFDYRLPEVFAGFARNARASRSPTRRPRQPQAWAAATPVLLLRVVLGLVPDRAGRVLRSEAQGLPEWLEGTSLTGIHAFGRRWTARVERGEVELEPA